MTSFSPKCSAHCLVSHVGLVLMLAPESGHHARIDQLEDELLLVQPPDVLRRVGRIVEQSEEELPQVTLAALTASLRGRATVDAGDRGCRGRSRIQ